MTRQHAEVRRPVVSSLSDAEHHHQCHTAIYLSIASVIPGYSSRLSCTICLCKDQRYNEMLMQHTPDKMINQHTTVCKYNTNNYGSSKPYLYLFLLASYTSHFPASLHIFASVKILIQIPRACWEQWV